MNFGGRSVVVTGGTGALGSAVVAALLEADAHCDVTYLDPQELEHFEPRDNQRVTLHQLDLRSEPAVTALYEQVDNIAASLHLAGGFAMGAIAQTSAADFHRMIDINALTCLLCCREAVKAMRRSASLRGPGSAGGTGGAGEAGASSSHCIGRIVNISARPAVAPAGGMIAYTTSKAAVASITQCLAEEVRNEGILVNAVLPSVIDTPANRKAMPDADFDTWPKPREIARVILHLAGPDNALTSGALVPVFGRA